MNNVAKTGLIFQSSNTMIGNRFVAERKVFARPPKEIRSSNSPKLLDIFNLLVPDLYVILICPIFVRDLVCDGIS